MIDISRFPTEMLQKLYISLTFEVQAGIIYPPKSEDEAIRLSKASNLKDKVEDELCRRKVSFPSVEELVKLMEL